VDEGVEFGLEADELYRCHIGIVLFTLLLLLLLLW